MNMYKNTRKIAMALAISLAMLGSTGSLAEGKPPSSDVTDARQSSQIWTTYALNRHLKAHDLEVSVKDGIATLTGKVDEDVSKELAEQIALNVDGIKKVDNQIEVDSEYKPTKASGERSYGEVIEDASITTIVKSKMLWSKHAQGLSANVDTKSGKVTLTGTADTAEAKEIAGLLASNTHGVNAVQNNLKVEKTKTKGKPEKESKEKSEIGQSISDTWITTKIKSTMAYSSNLDSSDISVNTLEGRVTLSGKVNSDAEHALAVELARNVKGVKKVHAKSLKSS